MEEGKEDRLQFNHLCTATKKTMSLQKPAYSLLFY